MLRQVDSDSIGAILKAETSDRIRSPFVLREEDLRRLVEDARQQMDSASDDSPVGFRYRVRLQDGSVVESSHLDDVVGLENGGSRAIVELSLISTTDPLASVDLVEYRSVDSSHTPVGIGIRFGAEPHALSLFPGFPAETTIRYRIWGQDRAWVFLSKTVVEDRLNRITRRGWGLFDAPVLVALSAVMIGLLVALFTSTSAMDAQPDMNEVLSQVQAAWESGEITDPVEAVIRIEIEKLKATDSPSLFAPRAIMIWLTLGVIVLLNVVRVRHSPRASFVWGDQVGVREKRERLGRSAFWMIGVAFVVAVVASFFVARLL